jgi:hypothetical protein
MIDGGEEYLKSFIRLHSLERKDRVEVEEKEENVSGYFNTSNQSIIETG